MSTTTTNGYKKPETGDRGSSWFADLEFNIDRVDGHTHDGEDSELISAVSIQKETATISSASWGSDLGGSSYKQTITLPTGYTFDETSMKFMISGGASDGRVIYPSVVKLTSTTYDVYINDNSQTLLVTYG